MSKWEQFEFEKRIRAILTEVAEEGPDHHLGIPFLTTASIALAGSSRHAVQRVTSPGRPSSYPIAPMT